MNPDRSFYRDGLRFECQGSGKCCLARGEYGYVYLTDHDRQRLADHLGLTLARFTEQYCGQTDGLYHLNNPGHDCLFLDGHHCRVHAARPVQCRTWPFWPRLLNAVDWQTEVASFCPGVGQGRLYTAQEIDDILWGGGEVPGMKDPPKS